MRVNVLTFIGLLVISGCSLIFNLPKQGKSYETITGLKYTFKKVKKGNKPTDGEIVVVHYTGKLEDGTVFDSSYERERPFFFKLGNTQVIEGWEEMLRLMPLGSVAEVVISPELAYGNKNVPGIPAGSTLYFTMELLNVLSPPEPYDGTGLDTLHMESGLKIIRINSTNKEQVTSFKEVTVHYTGFLPDGQIFDSSVEKGMPFIFTPGTGVVIKGLDKGVAQMRVGEKARMIIPPFLAYGKDGMPPTVPPHTQLIFDVEVLHVE